MKRIARWMLLSLAVVALNERAAMARVNLESPEKIAKERVGLLVDVFTKLASADHSPAPNEWEALADNCKDGAGEVGAEVRYIERDKESGMRFWCKKSKEDRFSPWYQDKMFSGDFLLSSYDGVIALVDYRKQDIKFSNTGTDYKIAIDVIAGYGVIPPVVVNQALREWIKKSLQIREPQKQRDKMLLPFNNAAK